MHLISETYLVRVANDEKATFQKFFWNLIRWISGTIVRVVPPVDRITPRSCSSAVSSEELIDILRFPCLYTPIESRSYVTYVFNSFRWFRWNVDSSQNCRAPQHSDREDLPECTGQMQWYSEVLYQAVQELHVNPFLRWAHSGVQHMWVVGRGLHREMTVVVWG